MKYSDLTYANGLRLNEWQRTLAKPKRLIFKWAREFAAKLGHSLPPTFLLIGAQKGGTSALFNYLTAHPQLAPARKKEVAFFNMDAHYSRGTNWYHAQFPLLNRGGEDKLSFEATPGYLYMSACPGRIHAYNPNMKLIVLLRNPVARAFSAWNMFRNMVRTNPVYLHQRLAAANEPVRRGIQQLMEAATFPDFAMAVREEMALIDNENALPEPSFIRRGLYAVQLERYFHYFSRERLLILHSEDLKRETSATLHQVTDFLQITLHDWNKAQLSPRHVGQYKQEIPVETRLLLEDFYAQHNRNLFALLGYEFDW